jgi:taurine--2-oxoglutarate transaminase
MNHEDIVKLSKEYTLASWLPQKNWVPMSMGKAEGVYFFDGSGKRYLDWSSQ